MFNLKNFRPFINYVIETLALWKEHWQKDAGRIILGILLGGVFVLFKLISLVILTETLVVKLGAFAIGLDVLLFIVYCIIYFIDKHHKHNKVVTKAHNIIVDIVEEALKCQKNAIIFLAGISTVYEMLFRLSLWEACYFYSAITFGYYYFITLNNRAKAYLESKNA